MGGDSAGMPTSGGMTVYNQLGYDPSQVQGGPSWTQRIGAGLQQFGGGGGGGSGGPVQRIDVQPIDTTDNPYYRPVPIPVPGEGQGQYADLIKALEMLLRGRGGSGGGGGGYI